MPKTWHDPIAVFCDAGALGSALDKAIVLCKIAERLTPGDYIYIV
jgi:hypothetical protein